jgi:enoyl-CoA hydratase/carnithine racemase
MARAAADERADRVIGLRQMPAGSGPRLERLVSCRRAADRMQEACRSTVEECRSAGIAVKMITGDHAATAVAIARQLKTIGLAP